jgi:sulfate-transporting ATPase
MYRRANHGRRICFNLQNLTKQHNRTTILNEINLAFYFGAKIGVIGGNGAGKSTLLRIMAGAGQGIHGRHATGAKNAVGYLPRNRSSIRPRTVAGNVNEGVAEARHDDRYDEICDLLGGDLSDAESGKTEQRTGPPAGHHRSRNLWELDHQVEMAMEALRLPPGDARWSRTSGGERRRVALCRLLLSNPDVLLLDEPTNHLDAESVAWLEEYLVKFKGTIVVVTHDRYFLSNVTEWILELEAGNGYPYKGNYAAWLEQKQALQDREDEGLGQSRQKLLEQELAWIRMNPGARRARKTRRA